MTILRKRMIEDLRIRNYSPRTIETYVGCVSKFARYFEKSPDRLRVEDIRAYQIYLVEEKKASWALFNQTVCALRFFYQVTLRRKWIVDHIPYSRKETKLPVVLSRDELATFFGAIKNIKHRTVLMTMYGSGLRISEALGLHVRDVDSKRLQLHIHQGKGKKDRYTLLSESLLNRLRDYWRYYRPTDWLFPGNDKKNPLHVSTVQHFFKIAKKKPESINQPHPIPSVIVLRPIF